MFDSIKLWISRDSVSNVDLLAEIPCHLKGLAEHQRDDDICISGSLNNLRVSVRETGVSISGSLAKYYLNDNINTLQRQDVQKAFEQIADNIHLPILDSKLTRVDIAQNFIMNYQPEMYYKYLGDCRYYKRLIQPRSLYYTNKSRTKLFYNKIVEIKKNGHLVPEIIQNSHLMRYEYRLTGRVPKSLKRENILAKDLFNESVYMYLVNEYIEEYENITKCKIINSNLNLEQIKSPKDFIKQLAMIKIQEIGQNNIMDLIEEMKAKQIFAQKDYYSRLKREIKDLCKLPNNSEESELIIELSQKIKALKSNYR